MAVEKTTYQVVLDAEERKLFRELRQLHANSMDLIFPPALPQLNQTLDLSVSAGCNRLGRYNIDPVDMIREFALAGADMLQKLVKNEVENETQSGKADDIDPVLGSNTQKATGDYEKIQAWNIPPCVINVIFTVNKEDMNPSSAAMLQEQFPGVIIADEPVQLNEAEFKKTTEIEKPKGITRMVLELDEVEMAKDSLLEKKLQEQFPWASFESKSDLSTSRTRTLSISNTNSASVQRLDPLRHLSDLVSYAIEPPSDDQFGYNLPLSESWATFSYSRKLEIAHARAIQGHYGRNADSGCTHCVERGYQCKIYRPQIANLTHINSGHSCQHCRLSKIECDLPAAVSARSAPTPTTSATSLKIDTQIESPARLRDTTRTPSTAITPKASLKSRMTTAESNTPMNVPNYDLDENPLLTTELQDTVDRELDILDTAEFIGLELPGRSNTVIFSMYKQWRNAGVVEPTGGQLWRMQHYYANLVSLYILAYARSEMDLAYLVLLRFQTAVSQPLDNRGKLSPLPDIETAVRAYQWLPSNAPLCRYLAIIFAYIWGTVEQGEYPEFIKLNPGLNGPATTRFLYAVTYVRDPFVKGHDDAVLERWCEVHDHSNGDEPDKAICKRMREIARGSPEEIDNVRAGKRKADGAPAYPYKKNKRGGSYASSR